MLSKAVGPEKLLEIVRIAIQKSTPFENLQAKDLQGMQSTACHKVCKVSICAFAFSPSSLWGVVVGERETERGS